jgi:ribosomal protein S18 acetylase RimI-like enzyme
MTAQGSDGNGGTGRKIILEPIQSDEITEAGELLGGAFITTPVVRTVLRNPSEKKASKVSKMFHMMLKGMGGDVFVAKENGEILGVMRMAESPGCQMRPSQGLRMIPGMLIHFGGDLPRILKFRSTWGKADPKEHHMHLDPLGVKVGHQGQGIGSMLLQHMCDHIDSRHLAGYLETDQEANVRLYRRFGFEVIGEAPVFDAPTYFMWRDPR